MGVQPFGVSCRVAGDLVLCWPRPERAGADPEVDRVRRVAMMSAVGAAVLAACAACTGTVSGHGTPTQDQVAAAPKFGTCWELRTSDFGSALDQPKRRPCSQPHDAETVWVATDTLDDSLPYPTEAQLDDTSGVVGKSLDAACNWRTINTYLGDDAGYYVAFVSWEARLPSQEQWAAGARWIRCDAVYGVDRPQLAPGRMSGALKGPHAADYRACYAGTPTDYDVVPCAKPHTAEIVGVGEELPDDVAFPTQARARQAMAASACGGGLDDVFRDTPPPAGYQLDLYIESDDSDPGKFTVSCVVDRADGAATTTVVLP
jgi:hypothetical protein